MHVLSNDGSSYNIQFNGVPLVAQYSSVRLRSQPAILHLQNVLISCGASDKRKQFITKHANITEDDFEIFFCLQFNGIYFDELLIIALWFYKGIDFKVVQ